MGPVSSGMTIVRTKPGQSPDKARNGNMTSVGRWLGGHFCIREKWNVRKPGWAAALQVHVASLHRACLNRSLSDLLMHLTSPTMYQYQRGCRQNPSSARVRQSGATVLSRRPGHSSGPFSTWFFFSLLVHGLWLFRV